jgi:hypothetical protein
VVGALLVVVSSGHGQQRSNRQISRQSAHEGGKVVSHTHRPPLLPGNILWFSCVLRGSVDPRTIVRPEGLCQRKIPMTPSWIEPATFRIVVQCLNQLRHRVPPKPYINVKYKLVKLLHLVSWFIWILWRRTYLRTSNSHLRKFGELRQRVHHFWPCLVQFLFDIS